MPRADGSIVIDTKLETKQIESGLKRLRSSLGKTARFAAGAFTAGTMVAVGAITAYTVAQIGAAESDMAGVRAQEAVAKSMGIYGKNVKQVTDRLGKYASTQAMLLGIDDDVIRSTQTKLLTFKELAKTAKQPGGYFDRAVATALDLQAAGFGDAASNAVQLGKALNDPVKGVTALARSGITFTAQEKKKIKELVESNRLFEAQGLVLRAIEKQVGGTALASAKASDRIRVAFDEMGEAFGYAFLPLVEQILPAISDFVTDLQPLMETLGTAIADLIAGTGTEAQVLTAAQNLGEFLGKSLEASVPFIATALNAMLTTLAGMIPSMAEAIGVLASNLVGTLATSLPLYLQAVIDGMLALIQALADNSDLWVAPMVDAAVDLVTILVTELTKQENIDALTDAGLKIGMALWDGFAASFGASWDEYWANIGKSFSIGGADPMTFGPVPVQSGKMTMTPRQRVLSQRDTAHSVYVTNNFNQPVRSFGETIAATKIGARALVN